MANRTATANTDKAFAGVVAAMFASVQARIDAGMTMNEAWDHFTSTVQSHAAQMAAFDEWCMTGGADGGMIGTEA